MFRIIADRTPDGCYKWLEEIREIVVGYFSRREKRMNHKQKTCFHRDWENVQNRIKPRTNSLP